MEQLVEDISPPVRIVIAAGGEFVGRARLQKTAFLLELAGFGSGYRFTYKCFGPFSEELASEVDSATLLQRLNEEQKTSDWGGTYSVFTAKVESEQNFDEVYENLVSIAKEANSITLELAATAAFLASSGDENAWEETKRRGAEMAINGKLEDAKELYKRFKQLNSPKAFPDI